MRPLYIYIAMFLAVFPLMISGAYAAGVIVTAGGSESKFDYSAIYSGGDNTQVSDSAVLSFNGGVGVYRQVSVYGDQVDINDTQNVTTYDNSMTAGVSINVSNAESATHTITLVPNPVTTRTTKVSASGTLEVTNADSIYAAAFANNTKGDYAEQSTSIESLSRNASLTGYSNKATADKTSATATQKFTSASTDGNIDIHGASWVMSGTDINYIAQTDIAFNGSGIGNPKAEVGTFTGTSTTKSEKSVSAIASAATLNGMNFTITGDSFNPEGDGTQINDSINGSISDSGTIARAEIQKYSISMGAVSSSASEKRSYGSISAGQVNISEFAMNAQNDSIGHYLDANSYWSSGTHYPVLIEKYCSLSSDTFKAQKTGVTGGVSIVGVNTGTYAAYLSLLSLAGHGFEDGTSMDSSFGQVSGTKTSLDKPKSGQAYKVTLKAGAKATSLTYSTIRGKGTDYSIYTQAESNALGDIVTQSVTSGKVLGKIYSASAATKSSGKLGDTKGASAAANIKFSSTYT